MNDDDVKKFELAQARLTVHRLETELGLVPRPPYETAPQEHRWIDPNSTDRLDRLILSDYRAAGRRPNDRCVPLNRAPD